MFKLLLTKLFKQGTIQVYKVVQTNRCIGKPEQFVKSMNKVKETEGIDIAIKKLQGLKKDFEQSDAIKNQTKNQSFKM